MYSASGHDLYTPREIALAAGVPEADVLAALDQTRNLIPHGEAVRLGRALAQRAAGGPRRVVAAPSSLFSIFADGAPARRSTGVPLAVSSTVHVGLVAMVL